MTFTLSGMLQFVAALLVCVALVVWVIPGVIYFWNLTFE